MVISWNKRVYCGTYRTKATRRACLQRTIQILSAKRQLSDVRDGRDWKGIPMPGIQETTYVKNFQHINDGLAINKNGRERCREIKSDVGQDYQDQASISRDRAPEMRIVRIDRIPCERLRKTKSRGNVPRSVAASKTNRGTLVLNSRRQNYHGTTVNPEAIDVQIRNFMERPDLRHCRLPGMLSRISRQACEGWQRQARFRASKLSVKIKLDPCKKCQFYMQTAAASLGQKH